MPEQFLSTTPAQQRARVARAVKQGDTAQELEARRDYAESKLAAYIARVIGEAPPLAPEQRNRLALLLRGDAA